MKKVTFFFGAGAEGKGNFNIRMGYDYLKSSLYASETLKGFEKALFSFLKDKSYFGDKFTYRKNMLDISNFVLKNFIIQKATHDRNYFDKHKKVILTLLSDEEIRHICDVLEIDNPPKHTSAASSGEDIDALKKEFKAILTGQKKEYSKINSVLLKETFQEGNKDQIDFDLNIGIGGSLDSYFHTIIDPYKYSVIRFSKIFNYYWACYFTILRDVLVFLSDCGRKEFDKYLTDSRELNYLEVLQNIEQLTKALYAFDINSIAPKNSYYQIIHQTLEKHKSEIQCTGVITTNYYRFCEIVSPNTMYLNGQLKCFEYPELLEVVDLTKRSGNKDNLLFPFIFGQSLVKPIVNAVQTEEFHRLNKLLGDTDILVIMGFNINEDDNHINTFLHDYVKNGKKLIIVSANEHFDAAKRLKCSSTEVCICKVSYGDNEGVVEKIFDVIMDKRKN